VPWLRRPVVHGRSYRCARRAADMILPSAAAGKAVTRYLRGALHSPLGLRPSLGDFIWQGETADQPVLCRVSRWSFAGS